MKRMRVLFGQRRVMVLITLTVLVLAAAALVASSASFTSTSTNPGNSFTAGNLHHVNGKNNQAILTVTKMKPGDTSSGTVTIQNDGDIDGTFTLAQSAVVAGAGTPSFASYLQLTITDQTTSTQVYTGALNGLGTVSLPTIAAGTTHTFQFSVLFPNGSAGNENQYKGTTASCTFDWTQVQ
jgi:spore coat-associated protein N